MELPPNTDEEDEENGENENDEDAESEENQENEEEEEEEDDDTEDKPLGIDLAARILTCWAITMTELFYLLRNCGSFDFFTVSIT
jgi:hypothetical protein